MRTANADQTLLDLSRTQGKDLGLITDWWENAERQVERVNYFLEQLIPGWKERGLETDDGVAESLKHALRESEEEAAEELAVPVQPALLSHWERVGGVIPRPV